MPPRLLERLEQTKNHVQNQPRVSKSVVIVGGSLAGLLQGISLQSAGYNVTLIEQDPDASQRHSQAAGITPGPDFLEFMKKHDRVQGPYTIGKGKTFIVDRNGNNARELPALFNYSSWGMLYSILRANFDGFPSTVCPNPPEALPNVQHLSGKRVTGVDFMDDGVKITYSDSQSGKTESINASLAIAADGSLSTIRNLLFPASRRTYTGYVSWRGSIPEIDASNATSEYFENVVKFYMALPRGYILAYKIPRDDGTLEPGTRLINWVWYHDMPEGSPDLRAAMTDLNGRVHFNTVTRDLLEPEAWERQRSFGVPLLPTPFAELLERTQKPFITKINSSESPQAVVRGRLFFVGEALNTLRPHTAQGTNQAAFHARLMEEVVKGNMTPREWSFEVVMRGRITGANSRFIGMMGFGRKLAMLGAYLSFLRLSLTYRIVGFLHRIFGGWKGSSYQEYVRK